MALVKVWNDNTHPFIGTFKDEPIRIPAKDFIKMNETDAHQFKCAYSPMKKLANGQQDPASYKMIRIEPLGEEKEVRPKFVCQYDGKEFSTEEDLEAYIDEHHLDKLADQEFAQKRRGRPKKVV